MTCDQIQEQLSQYLDNQLDDLQRREIEAHLAICPHCLPEAKFLSDTMKAVAGLPEVEPPAGFSQRVMTRVRAEAEKPTLWSRLFQPLPIKLPLHATALLLVVGLAVYLYRANEPVETPFVGSIPSASAPSPVPAAPPPQEAPQASSEQPQEKHSALAPPPAAPMRERFSENKPTAPETDRLDSSDQGNRPEEMMAKSKVEAPASDLTAAKFPPTRAEAPRAAGAMAKKEALTPADLLLTLIPKTETPEALSTKVKEIVARSGGTLYPSEKDDQGNTHFQLDLPKSEYNRFKGELAQIGEVVSESQISSPPSTGKPTSSMRVELTFLLEKPKEGAPAPPPSR